MGGGPLSFADGGSIPAAVGLGVEEPARWEQSGQAGRAAEHVPQRHAAPAGGRVQRAVGVERAPAPDARGWPRLGKRDQAIDTAFENDRVGIEQQQVAALRLLGRDIVGAGKADIVGALANALPGVTSEAGHVVLQHA